MEALQAAIHEYMDALGQQDLAKSLARLRDDLDAKHQTTLAAHEGLRSEQADLAAQLQDLAQQLNGSKSPKMDLPGGGLRRQASLQRTGTRSTSRRSPVDQRALAAKALPRPGARQDEGQGECSACVA